MVEIIKGFFLIGGGKRVPLLVKAGALLVLLTVLYQVPWPDFSALAAGIQTETAQWPWWALPLSLFILTSVLGVLAAMAGIGGSVLFVPIVSGFAPFIHLDFVRGTGLLVALAGALAAGPGLIRENLVNLRLAIPLALLASVGSLFGAVIGLSLPLQVVQVALGTVILFIVAVMLLVKPAEPGASPGGGFLSGIFGIEGRFLDPETGQEVIWHPKAMGLGLLLFTGVGLLAGIFGLGAGWAYMPVLNLVMGVPLRFAVATSYFLLAITDTTAALVYFNRGAVQPLITVPSILGSMLGARLGSWLLVRVDVRIIKKVAIGVLFLAGARALLRGVWL